MEELKIVTSVEEIKEETLKELSDNKGEEEENNE